MTIQSLLDQFYADIILVNRMSEMTALTYKISAQEFLEWLVQEKIKLREVTTQNLMYFLMKRKTDGNSELTIAKDISALRAFGDYLVRKNCSSVANTPRGISRSSTATPPPCGNAGTAIPRSTASAMWA